MIDVTPAKTKSKGPRKSSVVSAFGFLEIMGLETSPSSMIWPGAAGNRGFMSLAAVLWKPDFAEFWRIDETAVRYVATALHHGRTVAPFALRLRPPQD